MQSQELGIVVGFAGLGATLITAALALGGVTMPSALIWTMGGMGVMCMVAGAMIALLRARSSESSRLASELTVQMKRGNAIYDELIQGRYYPWWTALEAWEPIGEALVWINHVDATVADKLPEWLPELRDTGYLPDEVEPDDITVENTEKMLGGRVRVLGHIVRELRGEHR